MVSEALLSGGSANDDWKAIPRGAYGDRRDRLVWQDPRAMVVTRGHWGAKPLTDVGRDRPRPKAVLEKADELDDAAPIIGSLAGQRAQPFRVELDYPTRSFYRSP